MFIKFQLGSILANNKLKKLDRFCYLILSVFISKNMFTLDHSFSKEFY